MQFGGYKTVKHSRVVCVLRGILRESGAIVAPRETEVAAWTRQDGTRARLDISFVADGVRDYVDVTIRHPRAVKYVQRAAVNDGAAAAVAEAAKCSRYPAVAAAGLRPVVPFALETYGRLGPSAQRLLRQASARAIERDERLRGWAAQALSQRWLALLSCDLQRSQFEATRAASGSSGRLVAATPAAGSLVVAALPFQRQ